MKNLCHHLHLAAILFFICTTTSCATTSQEEIENTIEKTNVKSDEILMGNLALNISNEAENTLLQTDSVEICNVQVCYTSGGDTGLRLGCIRLIPTDSTFNPIKLPAQTFNPWSDNRLPRPSSGSYAIIYGTICTFTLAGDPFLLATGPMYTPIAATIAANQTTRLTITITPGCPLYVNINGTME